jgi:hypothetical protein
MTGDELSGFLNLGGGSAGKGGVGGNEYLDNFIDVYRISN